jgi:CheY-like chemotaxis protein
MGRGTGLGLASVYGIIKSHGGYINVYSEKERGTVFTIYLPASEKQVVREKDAIPAPIVKGSGTILLIDDEKMILDVGIELLDELGYTVISAMSGKEAIEVFQNGRDKIDLVIMDMIMPGMGGGETFDRLKEIDPDIKVLLSSGYSINGQATKILRRGCDGFIQKPFNMNQLAQKVQEILVGR